ncbi:peptidylprolyl isomerase [Vagococcus acidifermentans]|uniref:Foldase protein PrsA n=1 Tax=Vagococcus acidifermentans TaxID=564710 RepID=A0A430ANW6_9ENTE|nr:peptidylprolyl isomerase [Vagococcus acidifermentans]RSU09765.1 hypothetical protein CBF27_11820 [Vagococcus acidifermentans]
MIGKKFKVAALVLLSTVALAGCSSSKDVVSMKGGAISEQDFYEELKNLSTSSQVLQSMIISKIAEDNYGDKVTDKTVDKEFDKMQEQYGGKDAFESILKQNGLTAATYKEQIKKSLAQQEMLKAHIDITTDDYKEAWKTFHPEVETQIIQVEKEDTAKKLLEDIKKDGDFSKIAKENSIEAVTKEDGGKVKFDSTATTTPANVAIPDAVKTAAYKLEDGSVSDVIEVETAAADGSSSKSYYIVKMVKNQKKGNDYKPFKKQLKKIIEEQKLADATFQREVLQTELEKASPKIKDEQFKDILADYLPEKTEDSSTDKSSEKENTKESSTKESK